MGAGGTGSGAGEDSEQDTSLSGSEEKQALPSLDRMSPARSGSAQQGSEPKTVAQAGTPRLTEDPHFPPS